LIIVDTSGLVVAYSDSDPRHAQVIDLLKQEAGTLILSPFVLAELDYLMATRAGTQAELKMLSDVANGVYLRPDFRQRDIGMAGEIVEQYRDLRIGLADASIVVLAERYDTNRVLTFDQRHFRTIRPLSADAFAVLPADA
jgi:predicted nucleic acid-binding protein